MAQVRCEIDSIRVAAACPDELTLILKEADGSSYVPILISQHQGEILANELHGRPDSKRELDAFLASNNATDSDIVCATVHLEDSVFSAKVLFSPCHEPHEVSCPIGIALALAVRGKAPILADKAIFERAGVSLSAAAWEMEQ